MIPRSSLRWIRFLAAVVLAAGTAMVTAPATHADPPEVAVSVSPATVSPGDSVTVTVTLTNVHSFTILQPYARILSKPGALPSYTTLEGCSGATGACTTFDDGYQAPVGSLSGGASATVGFTLKISPTAPGGAQTLQGQLFGSNYATSPVDGPTLTILTKADVAVALTGTPRLGLLVPAIEFHVAVTNLGPATLGSATITTSLPPGLSATSTDCAPSAGSVACGFGKLPSGSGDGAGFRIPLKLLGIGLPYTFTARRTASSPQDPNPANDSATIQCTVVTPLLVTCT
jgi:hypothetical protein